MASIHKDIPIDADPDEVWAAVRDFGAVHHRLAPGFVTDARLEDDARIVTFHNGNVARELLVDCDDARRRLVYAIIGERVKHYSASVQVAADGAARTRMTWIVDVLPNEIAPYIPARWIRGCWRCRRRSGAVPHDDLPVSRCARRDGPAADRAGKMDLYGRFVGSWDLDVAQYAKDGSAPGARANGISAGRWKAARSRTSGSSRRAANGVMATRRPTSIPTARRCGSTIPGSMPGKSSGPTRSPRIFFI